MRARSGAVTSLVPIAAAMALLAFCLAGARLYGSSAASKAFDDQLAETCRSASALTLWLPSGPDDQPVVDEIASGLLHVETPRRNDVGVALLHNEGGPQRRLTLLHVTEAEHQVSPALDPLGPGEVALSRTNVTQLATELGGTLAVDNGPTLRVTQVFDDVITTPVPDYWCGWEDFFLPTVDGDPPPPSAIASPETIAAYGGTATDEYRVTASR